MKMFGKTLFQLIIFIGATDLNAASDLGVFPDGDLPGWAQAWVPKNSQLLFCRLGSLHGTDTQDVIVGFSVEDTGSDSVRNKVLILGLDGGKPRVYWEGPQTGNSVDARAYQLLNGGSSPVIFFTHTTGASVGGTILALRWDSGALKKLPGLGAGCWGYRIADMNHDGKSEVLITDRYARTWELVFELRGDRFHETTPDYPNLERNPQSGAPPLRPVSVLFGEYRHGKAEQAVRAFVELLHHPALPEAERYKLCHEKLLDSSDLFRGVALNSLRQFDARASQSLSVLADMLEKETDPDACSKILSAMALCGPASAAYIPRVLSLRSMKHLCWNCPMKYGNGRPKRSLAEIFYWALEVMGPGSIHYLRPLIQEETLDAGEISLLCTVLETFVYASRELEPDLARLAEKHPASESLRKILSLIRAVPDGD